MTPNTAQALADEFNQQIAALSDAFERNELQAIHEATGAQQTVLRLVQALHLIHEFEAAVQQRRSGFRWEL